MNHEKQSNACCPHRRPAGRLTDNSQPGSHPLGRFGATGNKRTAPEGYLDKGCEGAERQWRVTGQLIY